MTCPPSLPVRHSFFVFHPGLILWLVDSFPFYLERNGSHTRANIRSFRRLVALRPEMCETHLWGLCLIHVRTISLTWEVRRAWNGMDRDHFFRGPTEITSMGRGGEGKLRGTWSPLPLFLLFLLLSLFSLGPSSSFSCARGAHVACMGRQKREPPPEFPAFS